MPMLEPVNGHALPVATPLSGSKHKGRFGATEILKVINFNLVRRSKPTLFPCQGGKPHGALITSLMITQANALVL